MKPNPANRPPHRVLAFDAFHIFLAAMRALANGR